MSLRDEPVLYNWRTCQLVPNPQLLVYVNAAPKVQVREAVPPTNGKES